MAEKDCGESVQDYMQSYDSEEKKLRGIFCNFLKPRGEEEEAAIRRRRQLEYTQTDDERGGAEREK